MGTEQAHKRNGIAFVDVIEASIDHLVDTAVASDLAEFLILDEHVDREEPRTGPIGEPMLSLRGLGRNSPIGFELPAEPRGKTQSAEMCEHGGMIRDCQ